MRRLEKASEVIGNRRLPESLESSESEIRARPFLKWVGGKRQLLPEIAKHIPKHFGRYFEPFVGGGAVFFGLIAPHVAVLADVNVELIAVYRALQAEVEGVIRELKKHKYEREHYDRVRRKNFREGGLTERAADFIYCNKTGFNGLYRVNKSGQFNVPFGRYDNPTICDEENLRAVSKLLGQRHVNLRAGDFEEIVKDAVKGDFVYFDPPYAPLSATSSFTAYGSGGFDKTAQIRLRDLMRVLKRRGVHVLQSNSSAPLIRELYAGKEFEVHEVQAKRSVNSKADKRGAVTELLVT